MEWCELIGNEDDQRDFLFSACVQEVSLSWLKWSTITASFQSLNGTVTCSRTLSSTGNTRKLPYDSLPYDSLVHTLSGPWLVSIYESSWVWQAVLSRAQKHTRVPWIINTLSNRTHLASVSLDNLQPSPRSDHCTCQSGLCQARLCHLPSAQTHWSLHAIFDLWPRLPVVWPPVFECHALFSVEAFWTCCKTLPLWHYRVI